MEKLDHKPGVDVEKLCKLAQLALLSSYSGSKCVDRKQRSLLMILCYILVFEKTKL